jgi:hypothetical protein
MFMILLALVSLLLICLWNPVFEHMTNAAVATKHEFHQSKPTVWDMALKPTSTHKKADSPNKPIYGPRVPPVDPNEPAPSMPASGAGNGSGTSIYPQIYGPEEVKPPGHKDSAHNASSDMPLPYDYVPAAEFPAGPAEPAPFLSDFSKILKT